MNVHFGGPYDITVHFHLFKARDVWTKMNVHFRPPELDQPRYRPTTREERIPNLRDSIQRNSSSSSSSDEDGSSFEDSFEQMMENWADDDPLVLDQTG